MGDWVETVGQADNPEVATASLPEDAPAHLHSAVLASLYEDRPKAVRLNDVIQRLAETRRDPLTRAWAARSQAHIDHVSGDYERAIENYRTATALFEEEGVELEVGRSLLSGIQALIFRGRYDQPQEWASKARSIFERH